MAGASHISALQPGGGGRHGMWIAISANMNAPEWGRLRDGGSAPDAEVSQDIISTDWLLATSLTTTARVAMPSCVTA